MTYKKLKTIGKHAKAKVAFNVLLKSTKQERQRANNFPSDLYIAQQCAEQGQYQDCKLALKAAIEDEQNFTRLWSCIEFAHFYAFTDLRAIGVAKLTEYLSKYPYGAAEYLKKLYPGLLKMGEEKGALDIFKIAIRSFKGLSSFPSLVEWIVFLGESKYEKELDRALEHAINLCKPEDGSLFDISLWAFVPPSSCLLVTSQLSQKCERRDLVLQAADQSIACALAEPHESSENLLKFLEGLKRSLKKLHYRHLVKKVSYYRAEVENPTFNAPPLSKPRLFSIYWLGCEDAQGAEIKKVRPWIVITKSTPYGMRDVVTVVPLSTKKRGTISSIPIWFKGKEQEIRLDQVRSVDTGRLMGSYDTLPQNYQTQLVLAYKNSIGR